MSKIKKCKVCSKDIASKAKVCPGCGAKNSKPLYKRVWFWIIVVIAIIAIVGSNPGSEQGDTTNVKQTETVEKKEAPKEKDEKEKVAKESVPIEYKSALKKAKIYSKTMYMSKAGVYDQLTSEYGEKFSPESAQYAVDNLDVDWNENALKKAREYQNIMDMSPSAIYDQLISQYGEKFTEEEAQYAIDNLDK